jgi:hypothetical protein
MYIISSSFDSPITDTDLTDGYLEACSKVDHANAVTPALDEARRKLSEFSVQDILRFFDELASKWLMNEDQFLSEFGQYGVTFMLNFIRFNNLSKLLELSLGLPMHVMDDFVTIPDYPKKMMAVPKGTVVHWLAGNVPVLGVLSLIQGIITKNSNIIKLPKSNGLVLPRIMSKIRSHQKQTDVGVLTGEMILNTIQFVYCDRDDLKGQESLSSVADVRIAWGGAEAVESVLKLRKRYFTEDVIFGPKYSFAVIGNHIRQDGLEDLANRMAMDASVFDQQGCNSPHTVFVEKGGEIDSVTFAKSLSQGMEKALKRVPKAPITGKKAIEITQLRAESIFDGASIYQSKGTEWTVIHQDKAELAKACYSRVIFVRAVDRLSDALGMITPHVHQSIGVELSEDVKSDFAKKAAQAGINRLTTIGKMTVYDHPWDGMFPMNRLINWTSLG